MRCFNKRAGYRVGGGGAVVLPLPPLPRHITLTTTKIRVKSLRTGFT